SLGTGILEIPEIVQDPAMGQLWAPYLLAFITTFVASYFGLKLFMNVMRQGKLEYFAYYCVAVGLLVLFFL
ncbi:MAG: UDP pyrophosphate phosphatase, partial [Tetragenococcus halophilus]|nr:UDP pyrophosphate phosphatase [Tetragenococcus halophilus]